MASREAALRAQSAYYLVTGVWPLVHYDSFERATGRKAERWLVETAGGLIATIGMSLGLAAPQGRQGKATFALATGSAVTLGAIDLIYLARGRLRWVYGIDLLAQAAFVVAAGRSVGDPA